MKKGGFMSELLKTSKFWSSMGFVCTIVGAGVGLAATICSSEEQKAYIDSKINEQIEKIMMNASIEAKESI